MKPTLVLLALAVSANALPDFLNLPSVVKKSFDEIRSMSRADKLKHVRNNCPHLDYNDETVLSSLAENMEVEDVGKGFKKGFNCMTVVPKAEFLAALATKAPETAKHRSSNKSGRRKRQAAPPTVDWRSQGYVTPVQNQGNCGSCWTFSANGAMEGAIFKKTKRLPNLSEQNLVDCVLGTGSDGCNGGWMTDAYDYSVKNQGVDNETAYPYVAKKNPTCSYIAAKSGGKVASYAYTNQDDEADLKNKLATVGPIAVAMDASNIQNYVSGVFECTTYTDVNHGVLLVGYGTDSATGKDYWLIKNSWGTSWGEQGYIRIVRNKGSSLACGVPTYANYPIA